MSEGVLGCRTPSGGVVYAFAASSFADAFARASLYSRRYLMTSVILMQHAARSSRSTSPQLKRAAGMKHTSVTVSVMSRMSQKASQPMLVARLARTVAVERVIRSPFCKRTYNRCGRTGQLTKRNYVINRQKSQWPVHW